MPLPLIGLTTYSAENPAGHPISALATKYISAIEAAGGLPVLIPNRLTAQTAQALLMILDGVLFTGGGDIAIERFGGTPNPRVSAVDSERDEIELSLVRQAVGSGTPIFGICRGFQVVNVALGGTLYTDIEDQFKGALKHDFDSGTQRAYLAHEVNLEANSRLAKIMGLEKQNVNSLHHQGLKDLAKDLVPSAYAPDGLVEAVELPGKVFGVAVQWHPEWLSDQLAVQRLFRAFVDAADKRKQDGF